MNKHFINCLFFTAALFLFSGFSAYGQQLEAHEDHVYANPNVSGVGTSTVVYHLNSPLETNVLAELETYMESLNAVAQVDINGPDISIQFKHITSHQSIRLFIERMEMLYVYKNSKTN